MRRRLLHTVVLLAFIVATGAACAPQAGSDAGTGSEPEAISHGEVEDYVSLVDALRAKGAEVEPTDTVEQPFFDVTGQIITVNGMEVQVFEYASAEAAGEEASLIGPDGSAIGATMVTWLNAPHFYQQGRLIVLYVGNDENTLNLLESMVGRQIAGG